ncbi:MAG: PstS family phosphate ABC transporter substrate-binding protein [Planctomyces sp.]|nr:PstS family phosphate ABC transporter substrate-binding protein [Planctomyces sp.]
MSRMRCVFGMLAVLAIAGCTVEDTTPGDVAGGGDVKRIMVDGSSTVEPITSRIAEKFEVEFSDVQVPVKVTGTGTGFKELIAGRIDIANASRPIKDSEKEECQKNGIEFVELKIAIDGLSVVVHPENDWVTSLTVAQLKKIWEPGSTVTKWSDVDPSWPDHKISLFGAGEESGTFNYFTEAINGKDGAITENYSPSGDDNVIATGVAGDKYAMGFFGYAYYSRNKEKLKVVAVSPTENLADAVAPTPETIEAGTYTPLSRPLFIYVKKASLSRPEVEDFVRFYLGAGQAEVAAAGYVALSAAEVEASKAAFESAVGK